METFVKRRMLVGYIKSVQAVKIDEVISTGGQKRLPFPMRFNLRVGESGFNQDNPWAVFGKIKPFEDGPFRAFGIDVEEMDFARSVAVEDRSQGSRDYGPFLDVVSVLAGVALRDRLVQRGEAGAGHFIKVSFTTVRIGNRDLQIDILGAVGLDLPEPGVHRLDVYSPPAALIKRLGDGMANRVVGPDIHVKALLHRPQRPVKHDVLAILGIRYKGHFGRRDASAS